MWAPCPPLPISWAVDVEEVLSPTLSSGVHEPAPHEGREWGTLLPSPGTRAGLQGVACLGLPSDPADACPLRLGPVLPCPCPGPGGLGQILSLPWQACLWASARRKQTFLGSAHPCSRQAGGALLGEDRLAGRGKVFRGSWRAELRAGPLGEPLHTVLLTASWSQVPGILDRREGAAAGTRPGSPITAPPPAPTAGTSDPSFLYDLSWSQTRGQMWCLAQLCGWETPGGGEGQAEELKGLRGG